MRVRVMRFIGTLIVGILLFATVSFARENTVPYSYHGFILTCYINCESGYGQGSTSGAANPYKNYVSVQTYDINQALISASYQTAASKATLTLTKGRVYGTRTTHAAVDVNGQYLEDLSKSLVQYQGR